jgi:hypothetical protein
MVGFILFSVNEFSVIQFQSSNTFILYIDIVLLSDNGADSVQFLNISLSSQYNFQSLLYTVEFRFRQGFFNYISTEYIPLFIRYIVVHGCRFANNTREHFFFCLFKP